MRFSFTVLVATLIAAVTATPLGLRPRSCAALPTKNINGVSLKGPFKIKANAPGSKRNGNYAHAGQPNFVPFVVFGVTPAQASRRATEFYLNGSGNLVIIQDNEIYTTYEQTPSADKGSYLSVGTGDAVNQAGLVFCAIDQKSCALNCGVQALTYNCLGSQNFQPDWLITGTGESKKPNCAKFTPIVVA